MLVATAAHETMGGDGLVGQIRMIPTVPPNYVTTKPTLTSPQPPSHRPCLYEPLWTRQLAAGPIYRHLICVVSLCSDRFEFA